MSRSRAPLGPSALVCPSGVSGGTRPSGGSTTRDVCRVVTTFVPRSHQKSLYARARSTSVPAPSRRSWLFVVRFVFSSSAASSSVSTCFPASALGRSNGVIVAIDHTPCRSGSPHGVRGRSRLRALAFLGRNRDGCQRNHRGCTRERLTCSFCEDGHTSTLPQTPRICIRAVARSSPLGDRAACSSSTDA